MALFVAVNNGLVSVNFWLNPNNSVIIFRGHPKGDEGEVRRARSGRA